MLFLYSIWCLELMFLSIVHIILLFDSVWFRIFVQYSYQCKTVCCVPTQQELALMKFAFINILCYLWIWYYFLTYSLFSDLFTLTYFFKLYLSICITSWIFTIPCPKLAFIMKTLFYQLYEVPFVKLNVSPIYTLSILIQMNDRNCSSRKYTPLNNDPFHKTIIHITTIKKQKVSTLLVFLRFSLSLRHIP